MSLQMPAREPFDSCFQARLAQEVEAIDHEVSRLHAEQLTRAAEAASWAINSRNMGLADA